jgi:probable addiction module antidote protein
MAKGNKNSKPSDASGYLESDEDIAAYLTETMHTDDLDAVVHAIGVVAKARGMSQIAKKAGLSRESLYKSLSGGAHPRFETIVGVLKALGLRLNVEPMDEENARGLTRHNG